jgi:hypothetical protein
VPWWRSLPRWRHEQAHPNSLSALDEWIEEMDPTGRYPGTRLLLSYLATASDGLHAQDDARWQAVLALGPFTLRRRSPFSVPFIAVLSPRARIATQLLVVGGALASAFLEFAILPDVHVLRSKELELLRRMDHAEWQKTLAFSIPVFP